MDEICLVTPVLAGRADAAREFLGRLDGDSRADYQRSEQRLGISKEVWFLRLRTPRCLAGRLHRGRWLRSLASRVRSLA